MDIRAQMRVAIRATRQARIAAGKTRDSHEADMAYANAAASVLMRKIVGFQVTIDGEKVILPPDAVKIIFSAKENT